MPATDANNLYGTTTTDTDGATGPYGSLNHHQIEVNGQMVDILAVDGTRGVEFYRINTDVNGNHSLQLMYADRTMNTNEQSSNEGDFFESGGKLYYFESWDSTTDAQHPGGVNNTYEFDPATNAWTKASSMSDQDFNNYSNTVGNPYTTGSGTNTQIFEGADGHHYMWTDFGYGTDPAGHMITKMMWDQTTTEWVPVPANGNADGDITDLSYRNANGGGDVANVTQFRAATGFGAITDYQSSAMEIVETPDGFKMIMAGAITGNAPLGLSVIDLDENMNIIYDPTTGLVSRTTYNFATGQVTNSAGTITGTFTANGNIRTNLLMDNVSVNPYNGDIVLAGGTVNGSTTFGGVMAISSDGNSLRVFKPGGIGAPVSSTSQQPGMIDGDANVIYQDGMMYITSNASWTTSPAFNIILNADDTTNNYSTVEQGQETGIINQAHGNTASNNAQEIYETITLANGDTIVVSLTLPSATGTTTHIGIGSSLIGGGVCFAGGTMIQGASGPVAVETIRAGDMIRTRDHGLKPVKWAGQRRYSRIDLQREPKMRPICISAGALGRNAPERDLVVSPQHRILARSPLVERMFGAREILVAAKDLVQLPGVDSIVECDGITYVHILFDQHEIVFANGAEAESLYTGPEALANVPAEARDEILSMFPELADPAHLPQPARMIPPGKMARKLVLRAGKNSKRLCDAL